MGPMGYEKQRRLRAELDARFPPRHGNLGQQMFRSCYYNGREAGESPDEAVRTSLEAVRAHVPDFVPIDAFSHADA